MNQVEITHDPATWPRGNKIWDTCRAVAFAEGANVAGDAPDKYNNPGDLSKGDEHGCEVSGYVRLPDGEEEIIFAAKIDGWLALYRKWRNIFTGQSHVYRPTMTWLEVAKEYAGDSQDWVTNVTRALGVAPTSTLVMYYPPASAQEDLIT